MCSAPDNGASGYSPCPLFQNGVIYSAATGAGGGGQTLHTGVMNVALGDGSVRTVSASISQTTWSYACDPQDGNVLGSDW
ncbi:H-X9-DG-CTERM domain-containing protein [Fimbriiglobus ruber]|uniref:H-X9-DG-CTERM domain-containing protein n=1 Tax=Fimbriiglobus ruber TaxID=1908690 RepID=UPI00117B3FB0|nr:H-X9-DG-CTERM domain-containing protein [Fimbriiglobus ruber]